MTFQPVERVNFCFNFWQSCPKKFRSILSLIKEGSYQFSKVYLQIYKSAQKVVTSSLQGLLWVRVILLMPLSISLFTAEM